MSLPKCTALECERLKARLNAAERACMCAPKSRFARVQSQDWSAVRAAMGPASLTRQRWAAASSSPLKFNNV